MLLVSALCRRVVTGRAKSPRATFQFLSPISDSERDSPSGMPLWRSSITVYASSSRAADLMFKVPQSKSRWSHSEFEHITLGFVFLSGRPLKYERVPFE
jgi:hypothetical protein